MCYHHGVVLSRICYTSFIVSFLWILACEAWSPSLLYEPRGSGSDARIVSLPFTKTRLNAKKGNGGEEDVVALLHSHHLLDHKPDNLILKGGKHKLRGVACLGRPGVALCIGPSKSIAKFQRSLESAMPQKRFKTKILEKVSAETCYCGGKFDGFESVSLGEFRERLASIGEEGEFFALTGIAPEIATVGEGGASQDAGGKKGSKKKPKQK